MKAGNERPARARTAASSIVPATHEVTSSGNAPSGATGIIISGFRFTSAFLRLVLIKDSSSSVSCPQHIVENATLPANWPGVGFR